MVKTFKRNDQIHTCTVPVLRTAVLTVCLLTAKETVELNRGRLRKRDFRRFINAVVDKMPVGGESFDAFLDYLRSNVTVSDHVLCCHSLHICNDRHSVCWLSSLRGNERADSKSWACIFRRFYNTCLNSESIRSLVLGTFKK